MLTANGFTPHDYDQSANWKYCAAIYKKYIGKTAPDAETQGPGAGREAARHERQHQRRVPELSLFHDVATKVGPVPQRRQLGGHGEQLRPDRQPWRRPVRVAVGKGKYDFDDTFQLQSVRLDRFRRIGNWKSLTPYQNISE